MRKILRWFYYLAAIVTLILVLNYLIIPQFLVGYLKQQIAIKSPELVGMNVSVKSIKMSALFPFHIKFQTVTGRGEKISFNIGSLDVDVSPDFQDGNLIFATEVIIDDPNLSIRLFGSDAASVKGEKSEDSTTLVSTWNQKLFGLPVKFPLKVKLIRGDFRILYNLLDWVELKKTDFEVYKESLLDFQEPLNLELNSLVQLKTGQFLFDLPLAIRSKTLVASPSSVSSSDLSVVLGGVGTIVKGATKFSSVVTHQWNLDLKVPALEKLPVPAQFLPPGKWYGGMEGKIKFYQGPMGMPEFRTRFQTSNLVGDVDYRNEDLAAKGRLKAQLAWQLDYIKGQVTAPDISIFVSSDDMALEKKNMFKKTPGQPLNLTLKGYVTKDVLVLKEFNAQLARLKLDAAGLVGLVKGKTTDLTIRVPKTLLAGLEKMFPPLAQQPAKGSLSVQGRVSGDPFLGLEGLSIVADPIRLNGFSTTLNYRDDESKIYLIGPVAADLQAIVRSKGASVGKTTVQGSLDFTQLEVAYGEVFKKKIGSPLKLQVKVGNKGESLSTSGSTLFLGKGSLGVSGSVSGFSDPRMRLQLVMKDWPVDEVLKMTGYYDEYPIDGKVNGKVSVSGQWIGEKGVEASPLVINGELNPIIDSIAIKKVEAAKSQDTPEIEAPKLNEVPQFAPPWPIVKNLALIVRGTLGKMKYGDLTAKGVSFKTDIKGGAVSATANIQQLFGGRVALKKFQVPLLRSNPRLNLNASTSGVLVQEVLGFVMPEYSKEAAGELNMRMDVSTEMPSSVRFMSGLKGLVSLSSPEILVRSLKLNEMINQSLKKLPQIKVSPAKAEGFRGKVDLISAFADSRVKFNTLDILSVKQDELKLKGGMSLDGAIDLRGTMSLAKPPVQGDIYLCNADQKGRFVLPVSVVGKWNEPSFNFASSTIEALVKKTLSCQARKEKQKLEKKLNKELESATDKVSKDLEKKAKDKLKGLFK